MFEKESRINEIMVHPLFRQCLAMIEEKEKKRVFCKHDMAHFLDVARIAMILNLEEVQGIPGEHIYAAALLHDIGRHKQYEEGIPHQEASAMLAPKILADCRFDEKETFVIISAIEAHRREESATKQGLLGLIYRADKSSRSCFSCNQEKDCDWKKEKKNTYIKV